MDDFPTKLATVKTLNRFISPVISLKGKPIAGYPVLNKEIKTLSVCNHGTIGADELMLMDILGTYVIQFIYNFKEGIPVNFSKRIPKNSDYNIKQISGSRIPPIMLPLVIEKLKNIENGIIPEWLYKVQKKSLVINTCTYTMQPPVLLTIKDSLLFKQLPLLKKKIKTSKRLFELIQRTAECKLKMNFPIVLYENEEYKKHPYCNTNCFSSLFRFEVDPDQIAANGNVLSRKYQIKFDTLLGYFFMQNALSCYTNLLPGHFYNMSQYAQLFYRILILLYYNNVKIPISLKEIKARLVLKSDNSMSRKIVERILKELEANRFISNSEEILIDGSYWYKYKKNDWKTIINKN